MSLSQVALNRVGTLVMHQLFGGLTESLTYRVRTRDGTLTATYTVDGRFQQYRLNALSTDSILPTDEQCRIPTGSATLAPSVYDDLTRADGTLWRVMSVTGGIGAVWYYLQCRQVA